MSIRRLALSLFLLLAALPALAVPLAVADQVQSPAWLTRGDKVAPLAPGMEVKNGDRISTGAGARTYVKLAEGSTVKLGENAQFVFYSQSKKPQTNFHGALDVVTGAFRYTTGLLGKLKSRDLQVRVGTSTIGIRGTDIWGRASKEEDMAVLIEGQVEIRRGGDSVTLSEPLTQYRAPKGGELLPLTQIDQAALDVLARETDIWPGDGAVKKKGRWKLALGTVSTQDEALDLYDRARTAGLPARILVPRNEGGVSYTIHVPGFATRVEAEAMAARLKAALDIDAQVMR